MTEPHVAVLFDLDGTLIDSAPDLGAAAEQMRAERQLPPLGLEAYRAHASSGARGMLAVALGITPQHADFECLRAQYLQRYESQMLERTRAFAGVDALLTALEQSSVPWGIVTNKVERFALPIVAGMPILSRAGAVIGGDTTPHAKPHPAPLLEAARRMAVQPSQCVYVGDDERDIAAGRSAGMRTVAAIYGYLGHGTHWTSWGADASIAHPLELLDLLQRSS